MVLDLRLVMTAFIPKSPVPFRVGSSVDSGASRSSGAGFGHRDQVSSDEYRVWGVFEASWARLVPRLALAIPPSTKRC